MLSCIHCGRVVFGQREMVTWNTETVQVDRTDPREKLYSAPFIEVS